MQSKNPIDEEDTEETAIKKTGEITNMDFTGIEVTGTTGNIYTYQTGNLPVIYSKGKK